MPRCASRKSYNSRTYGLGRFCTCAENRFGPYSSVVTDLEIGARIRFERKKRKWTQEQLAERVGVDQGTVSGWESGKTISLNALREVLQEYGLSEVEFFTPMVGDPQPLKRRKAAGG